MQNYELKSTQSLPSFNNLTQTQTYLNTRPHIQFISAYNSYVQSTFSGTDFVHRKKGSLRRFWQLLIQILQFMCSLMLVRKKLNVEQFIQECWNSFQTFFFKLSFRILSFKSGRYFKLFLFLSFLSFIKTSQTEVIAVKHPESRVWDHALSSSLPPHGVFMFRFVCLSVSAVFFDGGGHLRSMP